MNGRTDAFIAKSMDVTGFFAKIKSLMHFWVEVVELPRSTVPE